MCNNSYNIAVLPGDGIGPEVMSQAIKVLKSICKRYALKININHYDVGGIAIDKYGTPLPIKTLSGCESSDAILFGSIGGPKWNHLPFDQQPETGALLKLRKHFNLFSNLRPIKSYSGLEYFSPLKKDIINKGFDILCIRELTGGIYFGQKGRNEKYAFDTAQYSIEEIERITYLAFELSKNRRKKITSIDKANVLETSFMWREIVNNINKKYPKVNVEHMYIDNAVMQIIKYPFNFDVILCSNMFGDIISDECAAIAGSIGLLPSASLNASGFGLYEPAGGSAPEISGCNIANPVAQILSLSMLLKFSFNLDQASQTIDQAVEKTLKNGIVTKDLISKNNKNFISTEEMGSTIASYINEDK